MALEGRDSSRRRHLEQLWKALLSSGSFPQLDRWISEEFRQHKSFGSSDRRWYSDQLFAAVRYGTLSIFLDEYLAGKSMSSVTSDDVSRAVEAFSRKYADGESVLRAWRAISPSRFFDWCFMRSSAEGRTPVFENLSRGLLNNDNLKCTLLWAGVPLHCHGWLQERVSRSQWTPAEVKTFLENLDRRPPLWLRLNRMEQKSAAVEMLRAEGFSVESEGVALRVAGTSGLTSARVFREGLVEIQDWASQQAGSFIAVKPGQMVWDACAGGGGKSLQIAAMLQNRGAVYASDVRAYKLDEVKKRARRAGFFNVRCLPWDGQSLPNFEREIQKRGGFDAVLVDAPCSASGTWRRNPDAKLRVSDSSVAELSQLQFEILQKVAPSVRAGGALVYATCSWIVAEDEEIVLRFLGANSNFKVERMELLGSPNNDSDTLFAAVLRRQN